ncbi:MAG: lactoylglutathione lyase [Anaerovibrio sp.]|nr:lactoylglutathione lyase [Anaerovibrio sp.]
MMKYSMAHTCIKVSCLQESLAFYRQALHLQEKGRIQCGRTVLVYLGDEAGSVYELELNCQLSHEGRYQLGENPGHFAFCVDDYEASLALHQQMQCVRLVSQEHGIYFISDPDGYIIEILPEGHHSVTERRNLHED